MKKSTPAKAFAKAYLNVFGAGITRTEIEAFQKAAEFLVQHRRALFFLKVLVIPEAIKKDGIQELINRFALPEESVKKLFDLLLSRKRAALLADVFYAIVEVYNDWHNHHMVQISSSSPLSVADKSAIQQFADVQFPGTKTYTFTIDSSLIAGMQIKSDTLMWESSIENYLRECAQAQMW